MATSKRRILRLPAVIERVGLCRSQIQEMERRKEFPRRVKLTKAATGYVESEVEEWIEARIAARPKVAESAPVPQQLRRRSRRDSGTNQPAA